MTQAKVWRRLTKHSHLVTPESNLTDMNDTYLPGMSKFLCVVFDFFVLLQSMKVVSWYIELQSVFHLEGLYIWFLFPVSFHVVSVHICLCGFITDVCDFAIPVFKNQIPIMKTWIDWNQQKHGLCLLCVGSCCFKCLITLHICFYFLAHISTLINKEWVIIISAFLNCIKTYNTPYLIISQDIIRYGVVSFLQRM